MMRNFRRSIPGQSGFTLLEVMVVVLIVGLMMSFVTISVSNATSKAIDQEARRMTALMQLASDESILSAKDMVILLGKNYYEFAVLGPEGKPVPIEDDDGTFRMRELPGHITLDAEVNGETLALTVEKQEEPPGIYIFSSGEMTPFKVELVDEDGPRYQIQGDFSGQIAYMGKVE